MDAKILFVGIALLAVAQAGRAQSPSVRAVAVIQSVYADSAGRAIDHGRPLKPAALDSLLARLQHTAGATVWFSWSGGPAHPRTRAQDLLLAKVRASGVRIELRTDSTFRSRVIRP